MDRNPEKARGSTINRCITVLRKIIEVESGFEDHFNTSRVKGFKNKRIKIGRHAALAREWWKTA